MGFLLFAVVIYVVAKLVSDASNLSAHNRWYKDYSTRVDRSMRQTHAKMAKEGDYAIRAFGMIDTGRYSDGSLRYNPRTGQRATKGEIKD